MIEKKLHNLKQIINDIDQQKLQSNDKIDSISLISLNLSRARHTEIESPIKIQQQLRQFYQTSSFSTQFNQYKTHKKISKTQSLIQPSLKKSPKLLFKYLNETNKNKLIRLALRFYEAKVKDMQIIYSQTGWQQFLKTFLTKNSCNGQYKNDRLILSGLSLMKNTFLIVNEVIRQYKIVDLSRNIIRIPDIINIKTTQKLQELTLKNCDMKNQQLTLLFTILLQTSIQKLNISSPDIKDRNNLTKYDQLYAFIQNSSTLQSLQLSNIQISPSCQIFNYATRSKTLKKLNLSKNTGVAGICKNIQELNLSWNGITKPIALKFNEALLLKLDLTGNPIPGYLFEEFFTTSNFPILQNLILNKIIFNIEAIWLQTYIQKTKTLQSLSMVQCGLSKTTFLNVIYGLQNNKSIKNLNLSGNKLPTQGVAQNFAISLQKSNVSSLSLSFCDIKDKCGAILFQALRTNAKIEHIDVSKNNLGQKTSQTICQCLKKGCYNLLQLNTTQNFIKYDQLKQIVGYINRNVYMAKVKVLQQHRKYKNMNSNSAEMMKKIQESQQRLELLKEETQRLSDIQKNKYKQKQVINALLLQQKIRILAQEQKIIQNKKNELLKQMQELGITPMDFQN